MSAKAPPWELWKWLGPAGPAFYTRVSALLHYFPTVRVNSWWRDPVLNRAVGGDEWSQHLYATAADLQTDEYTSAVVAAAPAFGLHPVVFPSGTAVHVQLYPARTLERWGIRPPVA
jgi:uncharacterized protein YcbK (DUF882 family)